MKQLINKEKFEKFYDKNYKRLLFIPLALLIISFAYVMLFYSQSGEFFHKDLSLTGGSSVTIFDKISGEQVESDLAGKLEDIDTREIYDLITREQTGLIIETKTRIDETRTVLESYLGYKLDDENSSIQFTGPSLGKSFFKQLVTAVLLAFLFMSFVVFFLFRTFVPSLAVMISAFADIFMTLALADFIGMKISAAGIVAFLMLIGYSVDTDILLTNRVLKRHGEVNERLFGAFKTGITMTLTSLLAIVFALIVSMSFSVVLTQIFAIIVIGLGFDILNTWITNASIIKWYAESRK